MASAPIVALVLVCCGALAEAGGAFILRTPGARLVDISEKVPPHCSRQIEKKLDDAGTMKVLYPPSLDELAKTSLVLMEGVHDVLTSELQLRAPVEVRLYLVQLDSYPKSLKVLEKLPGFPTWAFMTPGFSDSNRRLVVENVVYRTLPHEWAHLIMDAHYPAGSAVYRARWISDGVATYAQQVVLRKLAPEQFDKDRAQYRPYVHLAGTPLRDLVRWRNPLTIASLKRLDPEEETVRYGAAGGLFLRLREVGGREAVTSFLKTMARRKRVWEEDVQSALVQITGRTYEDLAAMSQEERESQPE